MINKNNIKNTKLQQSLIEIRNQVFLDIQKMFQQKAIEGHIFGSVGRQNFDAYSDLDLWFTFNDTDIENVLKNRLTYYSKISNIIHICEPPQNSPQGGVHSFILYKTKIGLLQVDYYLCPQSTSFKTKDSREIFGKINLPLGELGLNSQKKSVDKAYRIDFVITFVFIAIKNIARKKNTALADVIREYHYLSERYSIEANTLIDMENQSDMLRQIIVNLKNVSNDKQKNTLSEIELFLQQILEIKNIAFIDGQNLYVNTAKRETDSWNIDLHRFRTYLKNKYNVKNAYYFLGFIQEEHQNIYEEIQNSGFVIIFREHNVAMVGKKKGNVDSDIIFHVMKKLYKKEDFNKIILVSGDGDYKMLVDFLIEENAFEKILFPDKKYASSLYKKLGSQYFDYLDSPSVRDKIIKKKRAP